MPRIFHFIANPLRRQQRFSFVSAELNLAESTPQVCCVERHGGISLSWASEVASRIRDLVHNNVWMLKEKQNPLETISNVFRNLKKVVSSLYFGLPSGTPLLAQLISKIIIIFLILQNNSKVYYFIKMWNVWEAENSHVSTKFRKATVAWIWNTQVHVLSTCSSGWWACLWVTMKTLDTAV